MYTQYQRRVFKLNLGRDLNRLPDLPVTSSRKRSMSVLVKPKRALSAVRTLLS